MGLARAEGEVPARSRRLLAVVGALALVVAGCSLPRQAARQPPSAQPPPATAAARAISEHFGIGRPSRLTLVGAPVPVAAKTQVETDTGTPRRQRTAMARGVEGDWSARFAQSGTMTTPGVYAARGRPAAGVADRQPPARAIAGDEPADAEGRGEERADARIIEASTEPKGRTRAAGRAPVGGAPRRPSKGESGRDPGDQPGNARIIANFEGALQVPAGRSIQVRLSTPAERVAIADPEVAEVVLISPREVLINGKGRRENLNTGEVVIREAQTSVIVWDRHGRSDRRTLYVNRSRMEQILLEVTVAEVNRTALEQYGVDFNFFNDGNFVFSTPSKVATAGDTWSQMFPGATGVTGDFPLSPERLTFLYRNFNEDFTVFIEALQRESLAKILARPVVLARSGEQAHFRVGGEIPIVYATSDVATINFKEFGVLLTFTPEFTDEGRIDLRVEMEVSEPSSAFSTSFAGFEVPAFVSRQAETRVLLEEGQTLLLGGLYREQTSESEDKVPYLGDLPFLGRAFRRTVFNSTRTELLMAVKPAVARSATELAVRRLPTDRPPLSREEVGTRPNPYEVTRPRAGYGRPAPPEAGWPSVGDYLREKSAESIE